MSGHLDITVVQRTAEIATANASSELIPYAIILNSLNEIGQIFEVVTVLLESLKKSKKNEEWLKKELREMRMKHENDAEKMNKTKECLAEEYEQKLQAVNNSLTEKEAELDAMMKLLDQKQILIGNLELKISEKDFALKNIHSVLDYQVCVANHVQNTVSEILQRQEAIQQFESAVMVQLQKAEIDLNLLTEQSLIIKERQKLLEGQLEWKNELLEKQSKELSDANNSIASLQGSKKSLKNSMEVLSSQLSNATLEMKLLKESCEKKDQLLSEAEAANQSMKNTLRQCEEKLEICSRTNISLEKQLEIQMMANLKDGKNGDGEDGSKNDLEEKETSSTDRKSVV